MATRLHKVLLDKQTNPFAHITHQGKTLDLNADAKANNPTWPPYSDVCVETWELFFMTSATNKADVTLGLRSNARCSCAGPCAYHEDHSGETSAYDNVPGTSPSPATPVMTDHGPAQGYVEATLHLADLSALNVEATKAVGGTLSAGGSTTAYAYDADKTKALAAKLQADAAKFSLSANEIESSLGVLPGDAEGFISAVGGVATVLSGASKVADDYYAVMAFLKLYSRLVHQVHHKLTHQWPQAEVSKSLRYSQRTKAVA